MVPISFRERDQTRAVKVHAVKLNEAWVLVGVLAPGPKPDLPFLFIDHVDAAQDKFPLRNLVLDRACPGIHQIEMSPPIALGDVNHLVRFFEPVHILEIQTLSMSSPNKGLCLFINQISQRASLRIDFDHPISLVPSVDLY